MNLIGDYHTHTVYSHGMGSIEENVKAAIDKKLEVIAITDHGPRSEYGVDKKSFKKMRLEIDKLSKKYQNQIKILLGVEANILDVEGNLDIDIDFLNESDIILAGFHFDIIYREKLEKIRMELSRRTRIKHYIDKDIYEELKQVNTKSIINALNKYDINILTHLGDKYPVNIEKIAAIAQKHNTYLEINNFHRYLNCYQINKILKYKNLKFVVNSDAHRPKDVGNIKIAIKTLEKSNIDITRVVNIK